MEIKTTEYNGIAGVICTNCDTIIMVIVRSANYAANIAHCPAVAENGFFCTAPTVRMDLAEIDAAVQSYYDLNLAPTDQCIHDGCEACED